VAEGRGRTALPYLEGPEVGNDDAGSTSLLNAA
jgi:hypothetical protein